MKKQDYLDKENYIHEHSMLFWAQHGNLDILKQYEQYLFRGKNILDIGCNTGSVTLWMAFKYPNLRIEGTDCQSKAIEYAIKRKLDFKFPEEDRELDNITFHTGWIWDMPYKDKYIDNAYCIDVFEHIYKEDIDKTLKELHRVVKGCILFIVPNEKAHDDYRHVMHYSATQLSDVFLDSGLFNIMECKRNNKLIDPDGQPLDRINLLVKAVR